MSSVTGETLGKALTALLGLKNVMRRGWMVKLGISRPESVADHTYGVALLAALLAKAQGQNPYRAAFLALVHDLHEIVTGDKLPEETKGGEAEAVKSLVSNLSTEVAHLLEEAWTEYWEAKSIEAQIVREADKLEMLAQALLYEKDGYSAEALNGFWDSGHWEIRSELGRATWRALTLQRRGQ